MNQEGFIAIPLLIAIIASVIAVSTVATGVVLDRQGKLSPLVASITQVFKGTEDAEPEVKPEEPQLTEEQSQSEEINPEETSQAEQELEQARLEAEKAKQEAEEAERLRAQAEAERVKAEAERLKAEQEAKIARDEAEKAKMEVEEAKIESEAEDEDETGDETGDEDETESKPELEITSVSVDSLENSARVEWQTNILTNSKIFIWSDSFNKTSFESNSGFSTFHYADVNGLTGEQTYFYEIEAITSTDDFQKKTGQFYTYDTTPPILTSLKYRDGYPYIYIESNEPTKLTLFHMAWNSSEVCETDRTSTCIRPFFLAETEKPENISILKDDEFKTERSVNMEEILEHGILNYFTFELTDKGGNIYRPLNDYGDFWSKGRRIHY